MPWPANMERSYIDRVLIHSYLFFSITDVGNLNTGALVGPNLDSLLCSILCSVSAQPVCTFLPFSLLLGFFISDLPCVTMPKKTVYFTEKEHSEQQY